MVMVSRDILFPEQDPVRQGDVVDDPGDGVAALRPRRLDPAKV
jgi:hypothetical protein